ncbi:uncharacterized protein METZ01_LOCUS489718 [marine metagenome]|uniref:Uncharacterized protein n=1 Tax=marine metagenome TaxID=408172 RepID=A0A383CXQ5_9ZZZZ
MVSQVKISIEWAADNYKTIMNFHY